MNIEKRKTGLDFSSVTEFNQEYEISVCWLFLSITSDVSLIRRAICLGYMREREKEREKETVVNLLMKLKVECEKYI